MATYGRLRYQTSFYVGKQFQITLTSDMPFATYAPGDILQMYDRWYVHGRQVMRDPAYRIVRVEHAILVTDNEAVPMAEVILMYVYLARISRMAVLFEGLKTIARALFSASPASPPPSAGGKVMSQFV